MDSVQTLNIGGIDRPVEDATATCMNAELLQQTNALRKGRNLLEVFESEIEV